MCRQPLPIAVTIAVGALYCWLILYYSSNHQNTAEPAYQLVEKPTPKEDVQMDKNPAYSINDTQDTSEDHHYDFISDSGHAKVKGQI